LSLSFRDACAAGDVILTEGSTFSGAISIAGSAGLRLEGVPTDDQGMLPEALDDRLRSTNAKAVYTTPVCHNPLTFETGEARRSALLDVCLRHGALIVEDDAYAGYGTPGIATYKSMAPDHVYYCGGLSKTLTPLVRTGVLVPPAARLAPIAELMRASFRSAPAMSTAIACELIGSGADKAATQVLRNEASARTRIAREILGDSVAQGTAGTHVWLPMEETEADSFVSRALELGIRLPAPVVHRPALHHSSGVRVSLMSLQSRAELARALKELARLKRSEGAQFD
jgi:DNA-binding transcriptional MocR family regulator